MIAPGDLIATARKLMSGSAADCDLRRAVSTAYYALFHHLCFLFSGIVQRPGEAHYLRAFTQAYRYVDHGLAKSKCEQVVTGKLGFPRRIVYFAETFIDLQQARIEADYNPLAKFDAKSVLNLIENAESALASFDQDSPEAQRAFAIFVALKPKTRS